MNDGTTHRLTGTVTFANLVPVRAEGEAAIAAAGDRAVMDLAGLEDGNSAAVAVLMAWYRKARALGKEIVFVDVPAEVRNIIELSGLNGVLPLDEGRPNTRTVGMGR